jgi:hypothetical protein
MAIFDMYNAKPNKEIKEPVFAQEVTPDTVSFEDKVKAASFSKDRFFSTACIRLFFLVLLAVDVLWGIYCLFKMVFCLLLSGCFFYKKDVWERSLSRSWLSFKRSLVCALALFVSLFSTGFGIMIACTYFVMYDKEGIDEVVPSSLREYFKEFFHGPGLS